MAEYTFKLTGWPAVVVGALVLGTAAYQLASHFQRVDNEEGLVLKAWLSKDYQGLGPRDLVQRALDYKAGRPQQPLPEEQPMDIGFRSLSGHGSPTGMVVRADITVGGATPPKGPAVRYFYLGRDPGERWKVWGESTVVDYYTSLLQAKTYLKWRKEYGL
jgi:hypothetical protein